MHEEVQHIRIELLGVLQKRKVAHLWRIGSPYRAGRSPHWVKVKNPKAPAVKREAEEDWGRTRAQRPLRSGW